MDSESGFMAFHERRTSSSCASLNPIWFSLLCVFLNLCSFLGACDRSCLDVRVLMMVYIGKAGWLSARSRWCYFVDRWPLSTWAGQRLVTKKSYPHNSSKTFGWSSMCCLDLQNQIRFPFLLLTYYILLFGDSTWANWISFFSLSKHWKYYRVPTKVFTFSFRKNSAPTKIIEIQWISVCVSAKRPKYSLEFN